ncbi:YlbF family regulator [Companilactobacillus metriopterae]|uniref:YlbF family regulator n=1 Tax=Companilactobacillus metriopterae TaxID=1909267 RepID=UPI00100A94C0|nr:YlbF family regulator [Companilactobacillus metriopterae]
MNNIYDSANALEQDLRKATEVVELKEAFEAVKNNEVAFKLFDKVQNKQFELQQKQMMGQDVSDEDIESMKQLTDQLQNFDEFKTLMEKEQKMNAMMEELNKIITKPIADIYQSK